ncbi:acyl carrier protein [Pseudomonas sp. ABC1]|uniref:acyl carrier protein n=1 Tax=Pseudomonas sp. ABC1 TaxID=2748080 RepID=UPI0015C380CD|nr:acyl carrier protein [Pseudomonas sp. ABC1]QLF92482.1 acyl carrier protein [Pseudomonas sp. ABC1]
MSQEQFIESFLFATDFLKPVEVTMDTALRDLPEWDSIAALAVIVMFDMEYGKTITGADLKQEQTLGGLYTLTGL